VSGPKLFVSYSWTSPDHEAWVLQFATELRESGVDVILDKWDLREGHDAHAFMEKMVTDPEIKKVILVCDKTYVDKADGRSGGVGTEAQIISGEIYAKQAQDKFVAIVTERDESGRAHLPAYYRSRIYIDLSDASKYSENFDRLLRWAYAQPLYQKPEIGNKPSFLAEETATTVLATPFRFKRAVDSVKNNRDYAQPAVAEYFTCLAGEIEKLRIEPSTNPFDEAVIQSIDAFIPYRNEAIELFLTLAAYRDTPELRVVLHRFFEQLIPYLRRPQSVSSWHEHDFDNFRFIVHELFLYAVACLIRHERFESAAYLMAMTTTFLATRNTAATFWFNSMTLGSTRPRLKSATSDLIWEGCLFTQTYCCSAAKGLESSSGTLCRPISSSSCVTTLARGRAYGGR
jgi:SEFIR domain